MIFLFPRLSRVLPRFQGFPFEASLYLGCCEGEFGGVRYGGLLLLYIKPIWVMSYEVRVLFLTVRLVHRLCDCGCRSLWLMDIIRSCLLLYCVLFEASQFLSI